MRSLTQLLAVGILAGLALGGQARAQAPELQKVHILMVFDTNAKELAKSLGIDKRRMITLWKETIPQDRRTIKLLEGEEATKEQILNYYKNLQVGRNEGVVFYYAGHGATDKETRKHFFDLKKGPPLLREDLTSVMGSKKAELVLLLTDCCSSPQEFKEDDKLFEERAVGKIKTTDRVHPTVRCLLFQARGTVDITAATDNASWSDNLQGGIFTRSIHRMMKTPIDVLDANKDRFISWREFYPQLSNETQSLFGSWRKEMISRGEKVDERKQVPHAFKLGKLFAVVGIENLTKKTLEYSCRWPDEEGWTKVKLSPGDRKVHAVQLKETDSALPALEAKFTFKQDAVKLASREYSGSSEPTKLNNHYRIRPR
jgi:hypothetical protein